MCVVCGGGGMFVGVGQGNTLLLLWQLQKKVLFLTKVLVKDYVWWDGGGNTIHVLCVYCIIHVCCRC